MEQKRKRLFILLFGVLLILLAVYFGIQARNKSEEKKKEAKAEAETIYVTDIEDLKEIKYNVGMAILTLKKKAVHGMLQRIKIFHLCRVIPSRWQRLSAN
mgnify:CR=1 FL=1